MKVAIAGGGFGRITITTPKRHDEMIALTSRLAHIVSSAYAQNPPKRGRLIKETLDVPFHATISISPPKILFREGQKWRGV